MLVGQLLVALFSLATAHKLKPVYVKPNEGYYKFEFAPTGYQGRQEFIFHNKKAAILTVFDCYHYGDIFRVYINGHYVATTGEPELYDKAAIQAEAKAAAEVADVNGKKPDYCHPIPYPIHAECPNDPSFERDPFVCESDSLYGKTRIYLLPGYQNVTIVTALGCDDFNYGYLRVDNACTDNGFFERCCEEGPIGCTRKVNDDKYCNGRRHH